MATTRKIELLIKIPARRASLVATHLVCLCLLSGIGRSSAASAALSIPGAVKVTIEPAEAVDLGHLMPLDWFVHRSLAAHPTLRILMASGLSPAEARLSSARLGRFIQKPFTGEEVLKEVRAALAT